MAINPEIVSSNDTRANKPKINVTNLKSVFLGGSGAGSLASKAGALVPSGGGSISKNPKINQSKFIMPPESGLEEKVQTNTVKITKIITINKLHRENHQKDKSDFIKTKTLVQEIAETLQRDFEDRSDKQKKDKSDVAKESAKDAFDEEEKDLESKKKDKDVKKKTKTFVSPFTGILQKIKGVVLAIGGGILANAAFKYLGDPANYEKITSFFGFIQKHWKWVMGGLGAIAAIALAAPLVAVAATIGTVVAAIAGVAIVVAKIALAVGVIVGIIMGANKLFKWLRGGDKAADARKANREALNEAGVKRTRNKFGKAGFDVMRDGKKTFVKYDDLTEEERSAVDKFKAEDQRIKDVTAERNKTSTDRKKQIGIDRKNTEEYKNIEAMPKGKEKRIAMDEFKLETIRLQQESDKKTASEFAGKMKDESLISRKIGGDTSGKALVGENGPEIVEFKTATSLKRAETTQQILKDMSEGGGGVQIINQELPPVRASIPEVKVASPPATEVESVSSTNAFNQYMTFVPELLNIE